jgi:putative oxidoreductase
MSDLGLLIGRLAVAPMFLVAGWGKLGWPPGAGITGLLAAKGFPLPGVVAAGVVALEIVAPILLVIGVLTRWAAAGLAVFTLSTIFVVHAWWTYPEAQQAAQLTTALKNLAVAGLLTLIVLAGSGRYALRRD